MGFGRVAELGAGALLLEKTYYDKISRDCFF